MLFLTYAKYLMCKADYAEGTQVVCAHACFAFGLPLSSDPTLG